MSTARFKVHAQLDNAGASQAGTVTIDRETGLVTVRPHRRRKTYELLLDDVADLIVQTVIRAEEQERRREIARRRRERRAARTPRRRTRR